MRSDRKETIIFIIILLVLSMGIGYAFLTTTLSIDGTSDIDSATWDVHFENLTITSSTNIPNDQIYTPATISADGQTITFHVKLKEPSDSYAFNVDIYNAGTLDANIDSINLLLNGEPLIDNTTNVLPNYLGFNVYYNEDGIGDIRPNFLLVPQERRIIHVELFYNRWITPSDLPSDDVSFDFSFNINYTQANRGEYYYSHYKGLSFNSSKSNFHYLLNKSMIQNENNDFFLRYKFINDLLSESYVGFVLNNTTYYIRGGGATYNSNIEGYNCDSTYYNDNVNTIRQVFGEGNCTNDEYGWRCNGTSISANVDCFGNISIGSEYQICSVSSDGKSRCNSTDIH